jgi:hypothetical protein
MPQGDRKALSAIARPCILSLVVAALVGGCVGPLVDVTNVEETTAAELTATIKVFQASETPPNAAVLGPLTANSCKNKLWDKDATPEDATSQLRLLSRQRGGDAVGNLVCENQRGTSLATNCWASVTCTGTALKLGGSQVPALPRSPSRGISTRKKT